MTAAFFLVASGLLRERAGDVLVIDGAEGRHAATVRRIAVGEQVLVGDGSGDVVHGVVTAVEGKDHVEVTVHGFTRHVTPSPRLTVVQALAKGDRGELAVEMLTEVGVDAIVPWSASRSVSVWRGEKSVRGVEKWRSTAREAAKQSRRPFLPDVADLASTADVVSLVERVVAGGGAAYVLHEAAVASLPTAFADVSGVVLVVGPEGGIAEDELARLSDAGALAVRLGPGVLRTSTAGTVAAALVLSASGRWA